MRAWSDIPGAIDTPLVRYSPNTGTLIREEPEMIRLLRNTGQGAAISMWYAVAQELEGRGSKYTEDCKIIGPAAEPRVMGSIGYARWAYMVRWWRRSCGV